LIVLVDLERIWTDL